MLIPSVSLYLLSLYHGPLTRYVKLRVVHAPGMPGTFSPPPRISDTDVHHGTCVTHVPWCMPGSLTCGFLCNNVRGKRYRHSRRMRKPQFNVSCKRPIISALYFVLSDKYNKIQQKWSIAVKLRNHECEHIKCISRYLSSSNPYVSQLTWSS